MDHTGWTVFIVPGILVKILKLGLVKILKGKFSRDADVWLKFLVDD